MRLGRAKLNSKGCYYKAQPTAFNISLVQAPLSTDACSAKGASTWLLGGLAKNAAA